MQETQVINQLFWLPLIFLSGATIPFPSLPQCRSARRRCFFPPPIWCNGLQTRDLSFSMPSHDPACSELSWLWLLGRAHLLRFRATVPLGAGSQNSAQSQTLGRCHRHSLSAAGHLGSENRTGVIADGITMPRTTRWKPEIQRPAQVAILPDRETRNRSNSRNEPRAMQCAILVLALRHLPRHTGLTLCYMRVVPYSAILA